MSGLEPTYTNIIKQELEIGDLRQAVALVTGKLERLQQFVDRSEWGQERERLNARITELERDLEGCHRSNAELLVCGAQNCEPYRDLQSQLAELTQGRNEAQQERQAEHDKFVATNNSLDETTHRLAEVTQQYTAAIQHIEELVTTPRAAQLLSKLIQAERDIESLQQCQCDECEECLEGEAYCLRCVVKLREQLEAQSVTYQDNLTEIQLLKAHVVSREKEVDVMMAQRNLAEDKVLVLKRREVGYLSELDDYARTVLNLRSQLKACEAEHGLHRVQP
jgi:hypothetical protein